MASRRDLLKQLGMGMTALTVTGTAAIKGPAFTAFAEEQSLAAAPWWLLAPLTTSTAVGKGWYIRTLGEITEGASILTLEHCDGDSKNVHICVHDGEPKGLAHTEFLDLILMDGGRGDKPTNENLGRVLLGIANRIRQNELVAQAEFGELARLQTHQERVEHYGAGNLV